MNINYEYYRVFCVAAEYGNITKAAKALRSSQPNVTRAIARLEEQCGCTLFVRSNRGVRLTPEGERLYEKAGAAVRLLREAEEEMSAAVQLREGTVTLGATEIALNLLLLRHLSAFRRKHPGIHLRISNSSTVQALQFIRNGSVDFSLLTSPFEAEPPLVRTDLLSFRDILIAGSSFPVPKKQTLSIRDLKNYPLITLSPGTVSYAYFQSLFLKYGQELIPSTEVATADQILELVVGGLGLAFLPEEMSEKALEEGQIVQIPLKEELPARHISLVYDPRRPLSAAARAMIREICEGEGVPFPVPAEERENRHGK